MLSHRLRKLTDLLHFTIASEEGPLGTLAGIAFDPDAWSVEHVVAADPAEARESLIVPVRFFHAIDDKSRELRFSTDSGVLLSASGYRTGRVSGSPLFDAASLLGRTLHGCDRAVGEVQDMLVNIDSWKLRYLVVQTGGHRVLTDVEWCSSVDGGRGRVVVDLPAAAILEAPPYPGLEQLSSGHEEALYRHYTRRRYATNSGTV